MCSSIKRKRFYLFGKTQISRTGGQRFSDNSPNIVSEYFLVKESLKHDLRHYLVTSFHPQIKTVKINIRLGVGKRVNKHQNTVTLWKGNVLQY